MLNVGCGIENKFPDLIEYHNIELLDIPEQKINTGKERLLNVNKIIIFKYKIILLIQWFDNKRSTALSSNH